jgi:hypothetical protein
MKNFFNFVKVWLQNCCTDEFLARIRFDNYRELLIKGLKYRQEGNDVTNLLLSSFRL